jgi:hypothetical protein
MKKLSFQHRFTFSKQIDIQETVFPVEDMTSVRAGVQVYAPSCSLAHFAQSGLSDAYKHFEFILELWLRSEAEQKLQVSIYDGHFTYIRQP